MAYQGTDRFEIRPETAWTGNRYWTVGEIAPGGSEMLASEAYGLDAEQQARREAARLSSRSAWPGSSTMTIQRTPGPRE